MQNMENKFIVIENKNGAYDIVIRSNTLNINE